MNSFFDIIVSETFAYSILRVSTPIIFAAMASLVSKKAGVNNIALEGTMLFSALIGVLASAYTQSVLLGLLGAVAIGVGISLVLGYCSIRLKSDIFLVGIAINTFVSSATVFLLYLCTGDKGSSATLPSLAVPTVSLPLVRDIPVLGTILSEHNVLTYGALVSVLLVSVFLYRTRAGLRMRAVGEYAAAASSVGIRPTQMQYLALCICGVLCGLAGAFMSMGYATWFSRDMIAGRGFIAIAASAMGRDTPLGTLLASLIFGAADALSNSLQIFDVSSDLILMIPYLTTIIGITLYSIKARRKKHG